MAFKQNTKILYLFFMILASSFVYPAGDEEKPSDIHLINHAHEAGADGRIYHFYILRQLAMLGPNDFLILPEEQLETAKELIRYLNKNHVTDLSIDNLILVSGGKNYLESVELSISSIRDRLKRSLAGRKGILLPYIQVRETAEMARILGLDEHMGWNQESLTHPGELVNNKAYFLDKLEKNGIDVPQGYSVYTKAALIRAYDYFKMSGVNVMFAKLGRSASGRGVNEIHERDTLDEFMGMPSFKKHMSENIGVRLDVAIPHDSAPNVYIYIDRYTKTVKILGGSYQLLSKRNPTDVTGTIHIGNMGPLSDTDRKKLEPIVKDVAEVMIKENFFGFAGIDFVIDHSEKAYVLEVNGRINGNTPGLILATRLKSPFWGINNKVPVQRNATFKEIVDYFSHKKIEYDSKTNEGVIVINHSLVSEGYVQLVHIAKEKIRLEEMMNLTKDLRNISINDFHGFRNGSSSRNVSTEKLRVVKNPRSDFQNSRTYLRDKVKTKKFIRGKNKPSCLSLRKDLK